MALPQWHYQSITLEEVVSRAHSWEGYGLLYVYCAACQAEYGTECKAGFPYHNCPNCGESKYIWTGPELEEAWTEVEQLWERINSDK